MAADISVLPKEKDVKLTSVSKMELAASIKMQSMKIAEQLIKAREESKEDEKNYCTICYSNEIDPEDSKMTITFECGHSFCSECTLG